MTTKADPKPGRWILPLIIIGMVVFTFVFVGNITENTEPTDFTISLGGSDDDTSETTIDDGSTPSTTQPTGVVVDSESIAYSERITTLNTDLAALHTTMVATNDDFDARTIEYGAARDAIRDEINPGIVAWAAEVKSSVAPATNVELTALNTELAGRADGIVQASVDLLAGLQSSDDGEARASALLDLQNQVDGFNAAITAANS